MYNINIIFGILTSVQIALYSRTFCPPSHSSAVYISIIIPMLQVGFEAERARLASGHLSRGEVWTGDVLICSSIS